MTIRGFAVRYDDYEYQVGDICFKSHELYQDPEYDDNDELIHPYLEDGNYAGFYDGGELDGTSGLFIEEINIDDEEDTITNKMINETIKKYHPYLGRHIYLISSDVYYGGNDIGEVIMQNAKVEKIIR